MNYVATWLAREQDQRGRGVVDSHLASGVMSRVGRQQPFPICQQDNCKRRLKVASTCHVLLPILPPHFPTAHQWQSHVHSPSPLWTFATFQLWVAPSPAPSAATTVYAFPPFLPSLCLFFRFVFFAFFDNEKCSTRFSLLIYVLARFSYTLDLICCCCCFFFFSQRRGRSPHSISPVMAAFAAFFYASLCNLMSSFSWTFSLARRFVCDSICVIPKCDCSCQSNVQSTQ